MPRIGKSNADRPIGDQSLHITARCLVARGTWAVRPAAIVAVTRDSARHRPGSAHSPSAENRARLRRDETIGTMVRRAAVGPRGPVVVPPARATSAVGRARRPPRGLPGLPELRVQPILRPAASNRSHRVSRRRRGGTTPVARAVGCRSGTALRRGTRRVPEIRGGDPGMEVRGRRGTVVRHVEVRDPSPFGVANREERSRDEPPSPGADPRGMDGLGGMTQAGRGTRMKRGRGGRSGHSRKKVVAFEGSSVSVRGLRLPASARDKPPGARHETINRSKSL